MFNFSAGGRGGLGLRGEPHGLICGGNWKCALVQSEAVHANNLLLGRDKL